MGGVFTNCANKALRIASEGAGWRQHDFIGTEHILLGIVKEGNGVAADVFKNLGVQLHSITVEVEKCLIKGEGSPMHKLPFTPEAKKAIEYAVEESGNLNKVGVGTEHLLVGLLRNDQGRGRPKCFRSSACVWTM